METGYDVETVVRSVQRTPLGSQIADALRQDILFGRLLPGTRVAQRQLCEQFGTSRMPVRDALRTLLHEGLLILDAGQHMVVAPLSKSDLIDAFLIEGTLTGLAATRAAALSTPADLSELDTLHRQMLSATNGAKGVNGQASSLKSMADLNWVFHRKINQMSRSRKLLQALRVVSIDVPRDFLERLPEYHARSNDEHARILTAMRSKNAAKVGDLMAKHVVSSGNALIAYLEAQGVSLVPDSASAAPIEDGFVG
jgi:DNA-binding GntR family transcriptional regulator